MFLSLNRTSQNEVQTLGTLTVFNELHNPILSLATVELPWKDNQPFISCIPPGIYTCKKRYTKKHGLHWEIKDVYGRTVILIHIANFVSDLQGCVAVGLHHDDIDKDGYLDVGSSFAAMKKLRKVLPEELKIIIK